MIAAIVRRAALAWCALTMSFAAMAQEAVAARETVSTRPPSADIAALVDGYLSAALDQQGVPSAAIVLMQDGKPILSRAYGHADLKARKPATIDATIYRQASVSKLFTWVLVMQLVEEGKLDLDRDINAYLDFRLPQPYGKPITLRHLMTHSAGFDERLRGIFDVGEPKPLSELTRNNIPALIYAPGSTNSYSNYGAMLAGYIAERAAGKPYVQLVEDRILRPLGMKRSTFRQPLPAALKPMLAKGYPGGTTDGLDFEWVAAVPAGALSATPADMSRFLAMLLNEGGLDGVRILKPETVREMLRPQPAVAPVLKDSSFGLGFLTSSYRGVRYAGHSGNMSSSSTYLVLFPAHGIGWTLSFNGDGKNGAANRVRRELISLVASRLAEPGAAIGPKAIPAAQSTAKDVAGVYLPARRPQSSFLKISEILFVNEVVPAENGAITFEGATRKDGTPRRWLPVGRDLFMDEESGGLVGFERDASGKVIRMIDPSTQSERAPGWIAMIMPLLLLSLLAMVVAALSWPIGWVLRRSYRIATVAPTGPARLMLPAARIGSWLAVIAFGCWASYLLTAQARSELFTSEGDDLLLALRLLSIATLVGLIALVADAVLAWRDRSRGWPRRIGRTVGGLAALVLIWVIVRYELVTFGMSF